jgi:ankyrin repeat protein
MTFYKEYCKKQTRLKDALLTQYISDDDLNHTLIQSASCGKIEVVKLLLKHGANVCDEALRWSAYYGHIEVVKLLLRCGANVHANYDVSLKYSAENGSVEIVKLLLEHGANVSANNDYALRYSAINGHTEVVKLLLEYGANVGSDHDYALNLSARCGHTKTVKLLLRYYSPKYILQNNLHTIYGIRVCLEEYLLSRKRLVCVQRLSLDWLWRPNGCMCRRNWQKIKELN